MIPKIIHYCWLSNDPYPDNIQRCLDSWKRILPDYELILWDTNRFDISSSLWVQQAFESKKYAFAADYIRMYALYNYGGIYLDSDVEVLKPFDDLLDLPYFIGKEKTPSGIEAATMGSEKGWGLAKMMLDRYDNICFKGKDGHLDLRALPYLLRRCIEVNFQYRPILDKTQFAYDHSVINVFPEDYFSPKKWSDGIITVTSNTYSIHHFVASWASNDYYNKSGKNRFKERVALCYRKTASMRFKKVSLISNRPLAWQYYDYFFQEPCTPLLNAKVYSDDFIKLLEILPSNDELELDFIPQYQSKYSSAWNDFYPVGRIRNTDIEIHFVHSLTKEDANAKWKIGLDKMRGKIMVVAFICLTEEDEQLYRGIELPKFMLSSSDVCLKDLSQDNGDIYFWKRNSIMKCIRSKIKCALNNNGR